MFSKWGLLVSIRRRAQEMPAYQQSRAGSCIRTLYLILKTLLELRHLRLGMCCKQGGRGSLEQRGGAWGCREEQKHPSAKQTSQRRSERSQVRVLTSHHPVQTTWRAFEKATPRTNELKSLKAGTQASHSGGGVGVFPL